MQRSVMTDFPPLAPEPTRFPPSRSRSRLPQRLHRDSLQPPSREMPYAGRGGAGNIEAATQATSAYAGSQDLEAHENHLETHVESLPGFATQQEYAYTGRGGAGNYYSPSSLTQTGAFSTTIIPTKTTNPSTSVTSKRRKSSVSSPLTAKGPLYFGRGGAGNFCGDVTSTGAAEDDIKSSAEQEIKDKAERDVELGLAKPPHAWLGGREVDAGTGFQSTEES